MVKYIEFHPKIISQDIQSFVEFISTLNSLKKSPEIAVAVEASDILDNFFTRFPATMKDIMIKVHQENKKRIMSDAKKIIKSSNTSQELSATNFSIKLENKRRMSNNFHSNEPVRAQKTLVTTKNGEKIGRISLLDLQRTNLTTSAAESKQKMSQQSLIPLSENGLAFGIFSQSVIQGLLKPRVPLEVKNRLIDGMLSELRSIENPSEAFSSSKQFLNLVQNLLKNSD